MSASNIIHFKSFTSSSHCQLYDINNIYIQENYSSGSRTHTFDLILSPCTWIAFLQCGCRHGCGGRRGEWRFCHSTGKHVVAVCVPSPAGAWQVEGGWCCLSQLQRCPLIPLWCLNSCFLSTQNNFKDQNIKQQMFYSALTWALKEIFSLTFKCITTAQDPERGPDSLRKGRTWFTGGGRRGKQPLWTLWAILRFTGCFIPDFSSICHLWCLWCEAVLPAMVQVLGGIHEALSTIGAAV